MTQWTPNERNGTSGNVSTARYGRYQAVECQ